MIAIDFGIIVIRDRRNLIGFYVRDLAVFLLNVFVLGHRTAPEDLSLCSTWPDDLALRAKLRELASQRRGFVLNEIPRFSPAYEVYDEIRKCGDERIARSLKEAERFEE